MGANQSNFDSNLINALANPGPPQQLADGTVVSGPPRLVIPPPPPPPPIFQNCPTEFEYAPGGTDCIVKCPAGKGFELKTANGYSCEYADDPKISFALKTTPRYQSSKPAETYKNLPNAITYEAAIRDFNDNLKIALVKIDKEDQAAEAFGRLQDAEEVRDEAPDAYEKARVDYYTLTKGETWIEDEKKRVANTEAVPLMNKYLSSYSDLMNRTEQQKHTIDAVNGVRDNVLSVADDMKFSVSAFEKQLNELKNKIEIDKKKRVIEAATYTSWFDLIMNVLIALVTGVAIYFVGLAVMKRVSPSAPITPPTT
jgi:hypothetical protein